MPHLALIDYGAGNLHSVHNALKAAGASSISVTANPETVIRADRIVLPGVGAYAHCMAALSAIPEMIEAMDARVRGQGAPFLGICVGMQLLADKGVEHGTTEGLGWIGGTVRAIEPTDSGIKVPHMGWNDVSLSREHDLNEAGEAYYLHGYHYDVDDAADVLATTSHGAPLVAAVARDTMVGVQFHPEKSQGYGIAMLERFLKWRP